MWMAAGGVLLALLAAGIGLPVPEDLTLLTAGYLVWAGEAPIALMWAACFIGIVVGDSCLYWIGRKLGPRITQHKYLSHHLTPARMARVERFFLRRGPWAILLARFAAAARGAFYMTAGTMKLPYRKFVLFDAIAAILSVSFWTGMGWRFGAHIDKVRHYVKRVEHVAIIVVLAVLVAWIGGRFLRRWIEGPPEPA